MAIYKYWLPENGQTEDDAYTVDSEYRFPMSIAEDAASDFHYKRNGLEAQWPLLITVQLQNGTEKTFEIDREAQPFFIATEIR